MNAELDEVFRAMAVGAVPALWKAKSFPSLKPLASYVLDLLRRLRMFEDWCAPPLPTNPALPGRGDPRAYPRRHMQVPARRAARLLAPGLLLHALLHHGRPAGLRAPGARPH